VERLPHEAAEPIQQARHERDAARAEEERRARIRDAAVEALTAQAASLTQEQRREQLERLRQEHGWNVVPAACAQELVALPEPEGVEAGEGSEEERG